MVAPTIFTCANIDERRGWGEKTKEAYLISHSKKYRRVTRVYCFEFVFSKLFIRIAKKKKNAVAAWFLYINL